MDYVNIKATYKSRYPYRRLKELVYLRLSKYCFIVLVEFPNQEIFFYLGPCVCRIPKGQLCNRR